MSYNKKKLYEHLKDLIKQQKELKNKTEKVINKILGEEKNESKSR